MLQRFMTGVTHNLTDADMLSVSDMTEGWSGSEIEVTDVAFAFSVSLIHESCKMLCRESGGCIIYNPSKFLSRYTCVLS
jgi:hypothetical protein